MLDLSGLVFATVLVVFVAVRAVMLDAKLPWFPVPQAAPDAPAPPPPNVMVSEGRTVIPWRERAQAPSRFRRGRR